MTLPAQPTPSPYYIHAPQSLDDGALHTTQLHMLCHQLNQAGYPAYLVGAPKVHGHWWTPLLSNPIMAAHHVAGLKPVTIQGQHADESTRPGLQVRLQTACSNHQDTDAYARLQFSQAGALAGLTKDFNLRAALPWFDPAVLQQPLPCGPRSGALVYSGRLPGPRFTLRPEHAALTDLSPCAEHPLGAAERWQRLGQAQVLYAYAAGSIVTEARLLGCQVVFVANDHQLQTLPRHPLELWGTYLNTLEQALGEPGYSPQALREQCVALVQEAPELLRRLIDNTQAAAAALPPKLAWSPVQVQALDNWIPSSTAERATRADSMAADKLCQAYPAWQERARPAEVYGDICAKLITGEHVQPVTVHLFGHGRGASALADSLDALGESWLKPRHIVIHTDGSAPIPVHELGDNVQWIGPQDHWSAAATAAPEDWVVLLEAGTRPEPYALIELLTAATRQPQAQIIYAAHDAPWGPDKQLPHFTGGCNVEWLRGTNYLGGLVAVRADAWGALPDAGHYTSAYRLALRSSAAHGAASVHHVDQVLSHGTAQLAQGQEAAEFAVAQQELQRLYPGAQLHASAQLGCWSAHYPDPGNPITLIVPTGKQQGYLRALLLSCLRYYPQDFREALLVAQDEDLPALEQFVAQWTHADQLPLRILPSGGGTYNHARSLNLGLHAATTELVLVCDDDVEWLDAQALPALRSLFTQPDLALCAPRLVLQVGTRPLLTAGPQVAGEGARLLNYRGEQYGLSECGYFNRLQMAQDVAGVHGSCWLARRSALLAVGGLDAANTPVWQPVTDLGYRLQQAGWRLVWTPQASALHAGGATIKTVNQLPNKVLELAQSKIDETRYLEDRWIGFVGQHPLYSRHLRGDKAYTIETRVVSSWSTNHHLRPRVLATPLRSGSGQYRVIEPLNAVQFAGKAQTCIVPPEVLGKTERRVLTALDIARLQPERILVQHSISDIDIAQLRAIRQAHPQAFIVQLMDDLTSDLPASHPNHVPGQREGHMRIVQALELCNRLIVSTQPLADYYAPYCADIRLVPNSLDPRYWSQKMRPTAQRQRLRVGWAGAAQHLGDLRLVENLVRELAHEVDWIFMGMCPDELRPYVKEFHRFVSYKDYPAKLASLGLDIAIAPLEDNPFNACKSNLRLLEYGAMGWPVVCSDVYPFRTDDPPVLRVPNQHQAWMDALRPLLQDAALRQRQGQALHDWQQQHYQVQHHVDAWFHAIFD